MEFQGIITAFSDRVNENNGSNDNDFIGNDGLLHCGKCLRKKQTIVKFHWGEQTVSIMCKCAEERKEKREAEERKEKIRMNRERSFKNQKMLSFTFDSDDGNSSCTGIAKKYADNFEKFLTDGKGLLMFGTVGTGKTFLCACIVNSLIDKGYRCLMTDLPHLVNDMFNLAGEEKQQYMDSLARYDLLAIDDLGAERDTEYMGEQVYNIINARYLSGKPILITSNETSEGLKNPQDVRKQRVYSRLMEMTIPIEVKGVDRRKEILKEDYSEYKDLLGL